MHIHYIQHQEKESCGSIRTWAEKNGHSLTNTRMYKGENLPGNFDFDLLIVLGGSMDVHEQIKYPWLKEEIQFLKEIINHGSKVLGICLGAQLMAASMGAKVKKCPQKEIGWFPVHLTEAGKQSKVFSGLPDEFLATHWHEYTFELAPNAVLLAESEACRNQAAGFRKNALALQFHLEFQQDMLKAFLKDLPDHHGEEFVQSASEIHCVSPEQFKNMNVLLEKILDNFLLEI